VPSKSVRHLARFEHIDQRFRLHDAGGIGFNDDDGCIRAGEHEFGLFEKIDKARRVDDRKIDVAAIAVRESRSCRLCVRNIFGFVIGNGRTVGN
jgi:hypothetical protein